MTASGRGASRVALALSLATGLALGCSRGDSRSSQPPPVSEGAPAVDGHIDPAPYRSEIEATEAVLYSSDELGPDQRKTLSRALLELHNAIVFRDTSPEARETSRKLFFFSADVDSRKAPKEPGAQLAEVRATWEEIRSKQFIQADWFHTAMP